MTDAAAGSTGTEAQQAAAAAAPGAPAADAAAASAAAAAQTATDAAAQAAGEGDQQRIDTSGWPEEARTAYERQQTENARLRRERGDERIAAKSTARTEGQEAERLAIVKALAPLLGIEVPTGGEGAPTVESLTTQVAGVGTERDAALKRAGVVEQAWLAGIDPTKLGYLEFQLGRDTAFQQLDPHSDGFSDKLAASITALAGKDATLKLTGSAVASGVESLGGAGGQDTITQDRFNSMSIQEKSDLYRTDKATYDRLAGNAR